MPVFRIVTLLALVGIVPFKSLKATDKMDFWDVQQKGTNFFNEVETKQRFQDAKASDGVSTVASSGVAAVASEAKAAEHH